MTATAKRPSAMSPGSKEFQYFLGKSMSLLAVMSTNEAIQKTIVNANKINIIVSYLRWEANKNLVTLVADC